MQNLLAETLCALAENEKAADNVVAVINGNQSGSWADFIELADFDYDDGYGSNEIASCLVILFDDHSWLERGEYDGSEWWDYKKSPVVPVNSAPLTELSHSYVYEPLHIVSTKLIADNSDNPIPFTAGMTKD